MIRRAASFHARRQALAPKYAAGTKGYADDDEEEGKERDELVARSVLSPPSTVPYRALRRSSLTSAKFPRNLAPNNDEDVCGRVLGDGNLEMGSRRFGRSRRARRL